MKSFLLPLFSAVLSVWVSPLRAADAPPTKGRAEHVVLVVWDGMRPDFVSEENTPTLAALAKAGVFFERHHSVYPTMTEVNGTALATGCYPARSGILGNREYRPALNPLRPSAMESPDVIRRGDALTGGHYLGVPTLPELLHAAGRRTAIAGTKGVALLWDRAERPADSANVCVFGGETMPAEAAARINEALGGAFPKEITFPNAAQDLWTTRALTEVLWKDGVPPFSVLWMSDPDYSQHKSAPGSSLALRALRENSDANLRRVLEALDRHGVRDKTDVFVVSDHGFSTVTSTADAFKELSAAGLRAVPGLAAGPLKPGEIFLVPLGGTMAFYVGDREPATIRRLVEFLQGSDFAGVIFTRAEPVLPGTFPLALARLDSPEAPDVVISLRWNEDRNRDGTPGGIGSDPGRGVGFGTHATLSPYDVHNTLVAAGPDFPQGLRSIPPTGNVDLAPTIAAILGLPAGKMDGRVILDTMQNPVQTARDQVPFEIHDHRATTATWEQRLRTSTAGGGVYLDEGNGGLVKR